MLNGVPETFVEAGTIYKYMPSSSGSNGRVLAYDIVNKPEWATFSETTGELSGIPESSNVGTSGEIEIGVSDGTTRATVGPFHISVTPHDFVPDPTTPTGPTLPIDPIEPHAPVQPHAPVAPEIVGTPPATVTAGQAYSFTPIVTDPGSTAALSFSIVNRPAWTTFNTATGALSGKPTSANIGSFPNILISVSNGGTPVSLPAFAIQVVAAADNSPTISGAPATVVAAGAQYSFTPTAGDPDGGALTFSVVNAPSWASFNTSTGELSGAAPSSATASLFSNIVISVSDGTLSASMPAYSIKVQAQSGGGGGGGSGGGKGIKFHPGYYLELDENASLAANVATVASLKGAPGMKGVFLIVPWSNLELAEGVYTGGTGSGLGFDLVDQLLAAAKAANLQLMIGVQGKVFGDYRPNADSYGELPPYFDTTPDSTGVAPLYLSATANGVSGSLLETPKNYDPVVTTRRIALVQAYGSRYDSNPNFEMWNDEDETANGLYTNSGQYDGDVTQDIIWAAAARKAFPTSGLRLTTNFVDTSQQFNTLFNGIIPYGIAVGGPDVMVNNAGGTPPSYSNDFAGTDSIVFNGFIGGVDYRGVLPFVAETQWGDIPAADGPSYLTTLYAELFTGALGSGGSLMPNYWLIDEVNQGPGWSPASVAAWVGNAGSLNTTAPSSY
jgi:hypothetical protein